MEVPDLPGCTSGGATLAEAIIMGSDAASGWVLTELEDGNLRLRQALLKPFTQMPEVLLACLCLIWKLTLKHDMLIFLRSYKIP